MSIDVFPKSSPLQQVSAGDMAAAALPANPGQKSKSVSPSLTVPSRYSLASKLAAYREDDPQAHESLQKYLQSVPDVMLADECKKRLTAIQNTFVSDPSISPGLNKELWLLNELLHASAMRGNPSSAMSELAHSTLLLARQKEAAWNVRCPFTFARLSRLYLTCAAFPAPGERPSAARNLQLETTLAELKNSRPPHSAEPRLSLQSFPAEFLVSAAKCRLRILEKAATCSPLLPPMEQEKTCRELSMLFSALPSANIKNQEMFDLAPKAISLMLQRHAAIKEDLELRQLIREDVCQIFAAYPSLFQHNPQLFPPLEKDNFWAGILTDLDAKMDRPCLRERTHKRELYELELRWKELKHENSYYAFINFTRTLNQIASQGSAVAQEIQALWNLCLGQSQESLAQLISSYAKIALDQNRQLKVDSSDQVLRDFRQSRFALNLFYSAYIMHGAEEKDTIKLPSFANCSFISDSLWGANPHIYEKAKQRSADLSTLLKSVPPCCLTAEIKNRVNFLQDPQRSIRAKQDTTGHFRQDARIWELGELFLACSNRTQDNKELKQAAEAAMSYLLSKEAAACNSSCLLAAASKLVAAYPEAMPDFERLREATGNTVDKSKSRFSRD